MTVEEGEFRPGVATAAGDTGIWFVPTAGILPHKKWSASLYRTNMDDGQGFTDFSTFPVTFAVGIENRAELFGSWALVDADRPRHAAALFRQHGRRS